MATFSDFFLYNELAPLKTFRIHPAIAPYHINIRPDMDKSVRQHLLQYTEQNGIKIFESEDSYEELDELGIPCALSIATDAEKTGILNIRSRDTGYYHQAHISQINDLFKQFSAEFDLPVEGREMRKITQKTKDPVTIEKEKQREAALKSKQAAQRKQLAMAAIDV